MTTRKKITSFIYNTFRSYGIDIRRVKENLSMSGEPFEYQVGNYVLLFPPGHALPSMQERSPEYGHMLTRLAETLQKQNGTYAVIDIGANVGDSAAYIKTGADVPIYCIEGHKPYLEYLTRNVIQWNNVEVFPSFVSDKRGMANTMTIEENQGTIRLIQSKGSYVASFITLDQFVNEHTPAQTAKLLKIDTDGYDLRVLTGGMRYIKKTKPVIFFEYVKMYWERPEDGLSMLKRLQKIGYFGALFYDCFGELIMATSLDDVNVVESLDDYITRGEPALGYYDVCLFHQNDRRLAKQFINNERAYYKKARRTARN
ncbi:MAG: FkbM family methyltransferase [Candidatus Roizmanbacteria bacterium]|nr:FkbM family methyltransferase [Candidatus Roizmanbacteria bacterium]